MRKFFVLAAVLAAFAAAPAQANQPPQIVDTPVAGDSVVNQCTGETVTFVRGTFQIVFHETEDASDGFHFIVEGNAKGIEGVSDTGTHYRATGGFWAEGNKNGSTAQETFTVTEVFNLVSQGSGDNFTVESVFHFTVNSAGEVTSTFLRFADGTCRG